MGVSGRKGQRNKDRKVEVSKGTGLNTQMEEQRKTSEKRRGLSDMFYTGLLSGLSSVVGLQHRKHRNYREKSDACAGVCSCVSN